MKKLIPPTLIALAALATITAPAATEDASVKFSVTTDRPLIHRAAGPQEVIVRIDIEGIAKKRRVARQPLNLAVVLDRSGSMRGAKLEQARQAAEMVVDQLGPNDFFSLVIYDTEVEVLVSPQRLRGNADSIKRTIRRIEAGGSTALYHGVETGGQQLAEFFDARNINRVLLLSDGIANIGPSSNRDIARLGTQLANAGKSVTTIGLGEDYNEDLMTSLAEASDANYYYVSDVEALPEVFENELGELKSVIARRIELEITFPEGIEPLEILGRPETISNRRCVIRFNTLAAEQNREIFVACRIDPKVAKKEVQSVAKVNLSYASSGSEELDAAFRVTRETSVKATDDATLAAKTQVGAITAQAEIYRNAAATEKTIALADAGKTEEAKANLNSQIQRLRSAQVAAPAAQADSIEREIQVLEESEAAITNEGLSKSSRKTLQWNVFKRKNAKDESFGTR